MPMPLIIGGVNVDPRVNSARGAGSSWQTGNGFSGRSGSAASGGAIAPSPEALLILL